MQSMTIEEIIKATDGELLCGETDKIIENVTTN